ncbi:MAG TPA: rRNA maturation RNase YbeY [Bacteroidales bacterium]|nr:rRNA maturation RNase YbeY [Bacteroidales bacterium]
MPVRYFTEEIKFNLRNKRKINRWINETIENEKHLSGDINIIFTSDINILQINKKHLSHNYYTDIITFDYCEGKYIQGDIFISIDTVKNNSIRFNVLYEEEIHRVIIHGILHLIGYNDKTENEKAEMRQKENFYLDRLKKLF